VEEDLRQRGDKAINDFKQLAAKDLADLNTMLRDHNIGAIYLKSQ